MPINLNINQLFTPPHVGRESTPEIVHALSCGTPVCRAVAHFFLFPIGQPIIY